MFGLIPWRKESPTGLSRTADNPFEVMRREFDTLFDRFFGSWPSLDMQDEMPGWGLDVDDNGKEIVVRAEAPGFHPGDFDVQVAGDVLTIRAERKEGEGKEGPKQWTRLHRSVTLPAGVDPNRTEARYVNGVLEVKVGRSPEALPRKIEVKS